MYTCMYVWCVSVRVVHLFDAAVFGVHSLLAVGLPLHLQPLDVLPLLSGLLPVVLYLQLQRLDGLLPDL